MPTENARIRIAAVLGTTRPGNYTAKALAIALDEIGNAPGVELDFVDPGSMNLLPPGMGGGSESSAQLRDRVSRATGVILATPEYHGSFSSVTKLVIENLEFPSVRSGKPIALLGVAAGRIGAIKALEHLRSVCSHIGAIVLPGPISVAGVRQVFDAEGRCLDAGVEAAIRTVPRSLLDYVQHAVCPGVAMEEMMRRGPEFHWAPAGDGTA